MNFAFSRSFLGPACFAVLLTSCFGGDDDGGTSYDTTPPVLSAAFVDTSLTTHFIAFGAELSAGRYNPAYEVVVSSAAAQVIAPTGGVVERVEYNGGADAGQDDYEIFIRPRTNSAYLIIHDHVKNVAVSVGQTITAGQVLGTVGSDGGTGGRTELQINKHRTGLSDISPCPESFGTTAFNTAIEQALALHNAGYAPADPQYYVSVCVQTEVTP